jgi:hypothetical protein
LVALVNGDLQRIPDWSRDNSLILNASKTQPLLISRRIRPEDVRSDVILEVDSIRSSNVVKNFGLYVDGRLNWRKQVSYVVSRTLSALRLLYHFQRYTSRDLTIYLLIVSLFLYTDVVYFSSLTRAEFRRLGLAFYNFTRYVYGLWRFDHISEFAREILGDTLFEYLELQLARFIHKIVIFGAPDYLSSRRVLGRSPRHRFLIIPNPVPVTSLRGDSALCYGIRLRNVLPSAAKFFFSIGTIKREAKRFLTTADLSNHTHCPHHQGRIGSPNLDWIKSWAPKKKKLRRKKMLTKKKRSPRISSEMQT